MDSEERLRRRREQYRLRRDQETSKVAERRRRRNCDYQYDGVEPFEPHPIDPSASVQKLLGGLFSSRHCTGLQNT